MRDLVTSQRATTTRAERYYAEGWWRRDSFVDDLRAVASATPGRTAFVNWRREEGREVIVTFGELATYVDRLSAGLRGFGVCPGDAVAFQLPNWWETAALTLACLHAGAVAVPMMMTLGPREMERILSGTDARVCVVVDHWDASRPARLLADLGTRLPGLHHRVVIGDARTTGAAPFTDLLGPAVPDEGPTGRTARPPPGRTSDDRVPGGCDDVSLVLFTSGTTGEVKGVLHTPNTLYASARPRRNALRDVPDPRIGTPANLTHGLGMRTNVLIPMVTGCTSVFADTRDPETWLDLLVRHHVTHFLGAPEMLSGLVTAQRRRRRPLPHLRVVTSTGAPLPASVVGQVQEFLCPRLLNGFGMTEIGGLTVTAVDDPPDWPGYSIGRPTPGREIRLLPDTTEPATERDPRTEAANPGDLAESPTCDRPTEAADGSVFRLHVRSPSVCVGTFELRGRRLTWDPDATDGWYDTGDLVSEDGRGGLRYLSRVADRIGSPQPIPVLEVEDELLGHPAVADVAIVGYQNTDCKEIVCAVVVPDGTPPTLDGLRDHLLQRGMTEWYLPTRLECVDALPRNELGKVRKKELRDHLNHPGRA
ncbi:MAG: putative + SALICYL-S-ArCP [Sphaerisporangium sp.]|nr:putative + SALICYL-S-ArCP [Sphaerisporangium sp.]